MNVKESLAKLRGEIDVLDDQIIDLFKKRMGIALQTGDIKTSNNLSIVDEARENEAVARASQGVEEELSGEVKLLLRSIIALSREYQRKKLFKAETPFLPLSVKAKTDGVICAYQGVPGAWSEEALIKLFPKAERLAVETFEDVFLAVKNKKADYGVVAIENSRTGAIGETYDLLRKYGCFISGKTSVHSRHCLMAKEGVDLSDIREVYSHPEALRQCHNFLRDKAWDQIACRNTAMAAETAAKASDNRIAAIASRRAAEIYALKILAEDIMDDSGNSTSFVLISHDPQYDEKSDVVSITFATAHRVGALCECLMAFMAMGINLIRIESRPASMGNYRFFVDLEANIEDEALKAALKQASSVCEYLEVTGCYRHV